MTPGLKTGPTYSEPGLKTGLTYRSSGLLLAAAAAATSTDRRLFSVSASARRRRPAIHRGAVLHESHVRTERIAREVLLARVAPELSGFERRVAAHVQQRLISRIVLRPP